MRRLIATTLGTLATVAVVLVLLLGFGLAGGAFAHTARPASAPTATHAGGLAAAAVVAKPAQLVHPAQSTPPVVTISGLTTFTGVNPTPALATFTIAVTGWTSNNSSALDSTNTVVSVSFTDLGTGVTTNTESLAVAANQTSYSFNFSGDEVHPDMLGTPTFGQWYSAQVTVTVWNNTNATEPAQGVAVAATSGAFVFPPATAPTVSVTFTSTIHGLYVVAPLTETFTIAVTGVTIDPSTVSVAVKFTHFVGTHGTLFNTLALDVAPDQTDYSFNITNTTATGGSIPVAPGGQWTFVASVTATDPVAAITDAANSSATATSGLTANVAFSPLTGSFVAPAAGHYVGLGNVTVVITYGGDFVQNANVTIYKGSAAGQIVFASPTFAPGAGNHTVAAIAPWVATAGGLYWASLTVNASYTQQSFGEWINVTNASGGGNNLPPATIWNNQTTWHNSTLIPGLSTAAGGTLLLVVGLIVGLLVALVLGRMMWGSAKAAPAQQWQPKPGTNECSVCHQQFPTEDALKEHQKTAHGMG